MKDFHFFACMPTERKSKSASKAWPLPWTRATVKGYALPSLPPDTGPRKYVDCVAVYTDRSLYYVRDGECMIEAVTSVYEHPNSACCGSAVSRSFLQKRCVRIDEKLARKVHPALFEYLDRE